MTTDGKSSGGGPAVAGLTVNQVVAYNLGRARKGRGWTQEETARKLEAESGKKWSAATLSAAERSVETGRPRQFDANEIVCFSRVFEYPVAYFFLPIATKLEETVVFYFLSRPGGADEGEGGTALETLELLDSVLPLKFPPSLVEDVNRLLRSRGVAWQPSATMTWDDEHDDYDAWMAINHDREESRQFSLDEWQTIVDFASLMKKRSQPEVLRLLADAMSETPRNNAVPLEDPPF
ncbi:helix-turn-helix domain-containing protein [Streptomyces mirabilis]|uniref:helix-turn-helix domain-containing protein n=1 Tax=Streptomyces mirabilis TaxID=68239 RepID=UPI0033F25124